MSNLRLRPTGAPEWKEHERQVAQAYQALGYSVTSNVSIDGQQVDVVCERHLAGAGRLKLYVECKYSAPGNPSISKDEVTQFIANFRALKDSCGFTIGVMVSNQPFSQYARAAIANHLDIALTTLDALETEAFGVPRYLHKVLDGYSDDGGFFDYVELNAARDAGESRLEPVHEIFDAWLTDETAPQLCLLGDFGAGKSTFFARMQSRLAKRYLDGQFNRMPLLLPLREVGMAEDGPEIIERFFAQHVGIPVPYARFQRFNAAGRFILLLDGFDEMAAASDRAARHRNYIKLCQLLAPRAKVAISCRPAYFVSETELQSVLDYWASQVTFSVVNRPGGRRTSRKQAQVSQLLVGQQGSEEYRQRAILSNVSFSNYVIRLELFNRKQIKEYIAYHRAHIVDASGGQLDDVSLLQRIESIYDLEDLARRPILLKLIVETLPKFRKSAGGGYEVTIGTELITRKTITPSLLYHVYTERELTREYEKGQSRWRIDRDGRRRVVAKLAYELLRRERTTIGSDDLTELIIQELGVDHTAAEAATTDVRSTSFLARERTDDVRFSHKSFTEYFAAAYIATLMGGMGATKAALATHPFSDEVLYFLGDILAAEKPMLLAKYARLCARVQRPSDTQSVVRQNAANILNYARKPAEAITDLGCDRLSYLRLDIGTLTFDDCRIAEVDIKRTTIANWRCTRTSLKRVKISESASIHAEFSRLSNVNLEWRHGRGCVSFTNASGAVAVGHGAAAAVVGVDSRLRLKTEADGMFANIACHDSIVVGAGTALALHPSGGRSRLTNCILIQVPISELLRRGVEITNCLSIACSIDSLADLRLTLGIQGYVVLRDREKYRQRVTDRLMVFGNGTMERIAKLAGQLTDELLRKHEWEEILVMGFPRDGMPSLDKLMPDQARQLWHMTRTDWSRHFHLT
jgi:hypothetical protein